MHAIRQNLSIVEAVRDQLREEAGMLAAQVTRYEDIINELQAKEEKLADEMEAVKNELYAKIN